MSRSLAFAAIAIALAAVIILAAISCAGAAGATR